MDELNSGYIALISSVATATVTLLAVWITNSFNAKQLKRQLNFESEEKKLALIGQRAEELYEITDKWLLSLGVAHLNLYAVKLNKIDYNQYLELTIEQGESSNSSIGRLDMILHLYFPPLVPQYKEIKQVRSNINKIAGDFKIFYQSGNTNNETFIKSFLEAGDKLDKVGDSFKASIVNHVQQLKLNK
jgi:hypothetical protein